MTNIPTIDGVSRYSHGSICMFEDGSGEWPHIDDVRALLDAPAVERKEPALLGYRIETEHGHHFKDSPTRGVGINCIELADRSELAALQSIIAQLQARIAELESGRGEPVAWMCMSRDGYAQRCTKTDPEGFPVYRAPPAPVAVVLPERMTREQALELTDYPPESAMYWYNKALDDVRACLDATAALNIPK